MKIFISWSGVRSKHIAEAFREWLPNVMQSLKPFISTHDIGKGTRGVVTLATELEASHVGIICLTPENLNQPWILFEAGALSKASSAHVCTYLFDLEPSGVSPPLGMFQHTKATKDDTIALLRTINAHMGENKLEKERLDAAAEQWWGSFQTALGQTPARPVSESLPTARSDGSKLDELLNLVRGLRSAEIHSHTDKRSPVSYIREPTAARLLGITIEELNELRDTKQLFAFRLGSGWVYRRRDIEDLRVRRKTDD